MSSLSGHLQDVVAYENLDSLAHCKCILHNSLNFFIHMKSQSQEKIQYFPLTNFSTIVLPKDVIMLQHLVV